jgi:plastocyanin
MAEEAVRERLIALRFRWLASATILCLVAASCGGDQTGGSIEGQTVTVKMFDNRYEYTEVHVPVGGSVTFVGAGRNPHNAVAADGTWSTEDDFGSLDQLEGDAATIVYDEPGEYVFFWTFHGNAEGTGMAGKLIVGGEDG